MKLLGTTTSPYTRKIRVLLDAIRRPYEFLDTRTDVGAATLARVAPLAKIPVLLVDEKPDGMALPDSSLIASWLWATEAPAFRAAGWNLDPSGWSDRAMQVAVEGMMDAAINHRYLRLDGFAESGYIGKQKQRAERMFAYLEQAGIAFTRPLGLAALSLGCGLDWIVFRNIADLGQYPALRAFREGWIASGVGAGSEPRE